jgi:hypothetical protein
MYRKLLIALAEKTMHVFAEVKKSAAHGPFISAQRDLQKHGSLRALRRVTSHG